MYIPLIGIALIVTWGAVDLARNRISHLRIVASAGAAVCLALSITATAQVDHWRNTLALFEHATAVTSDNYYAHNAIAGVHLEAARLDIAETHYREALRTAPGWAEPHLGLANVFVARRDLASAVVEYRNALDIYPDHPVAHLQLGIVQLEHGQAARALEHLKRAEVLARASVELDAASAELSTSLGVALARTGDSRAAVARLEAALRRRPDLTLAKVELAWLLATCGDPSVRDPVEALRIAKSLANDELPDLGRVRILDVHAAALAASGQFDAAVATAENAVSLLRDAENPARRRGIERRLELYESGRPYIAPIRKRAR
jgi:tetratricopeptide (TPR) repeat protein